MNTVQTIAKNTLALTLAQIVPMLLGIILVFYIARILGDVGFGKYSFAFAFTGLFTILADLGLNTLTVREVARDKSRASKYLGNIVIIEIILSVITLTLIFLAINSMDYPPDTTLAVYIVAFSLVLTSISQLFKSIFRAFEKMEYEFLINTLRTIIVVSLGLFVLFAGYGLIGLVLVHLLASVFGLLFSLSLCLKKFAVPKLEVDLHFWKHSIRTALPLGFVYIFAVIYGQIDMTMLSVMCGDAVVGWYSAAYKLRSVLGFIPASFMNAAFPVMSRFFESSTKSLEVLYKRSFKYMLSLALPIAVGTTILADRIILPLYGAQYVNSIIALQILIWAIVFSFPAYLLEYVLFSTNRQDITGITSGICAVSNVILNLLLIPSLSYVGAAIATVITSGILFGIYFYFVFKYGYKLSMHKIAIKPLIASLVMAVFIYCFYSFNLFLLVLLAAIVYLGALYLLKGISQDDIRMFKEMFKA
jgi:O-antigen/teichoic acid export membrane protein